MRTRVAIVGAGLSGLLLSHLLAADGIESIVPETRSEEYVTSRIRAGVLEDAAAELLAAVGLGDRLRRRHGALRHLPAVAARAAPHRFRRVDRAQRADLRPDGGAEGSRRRAPSRRPADRNVALLVARAVVRDLATKLGLTAVAPGQVNDLPEARLAIDVSGSRAGFDMALRRAGPDGVVSCAGGLCRSVRVPMLRSVGRNITVHIARSNARTVIPDVLTIIADGRLHPERVTTLVAPLDDATDAITEHCRDDAIKTVVTA